MEIGFELWGLFGTCFLSSTLLPFPSEAALIYILQTDDRIALILTIATLGNSLGGSTNYLLGVWGRKLTNKSHLRAEKLFNRFGIWTALLGWLPFIGDPLMLVLGFYKTPVWPTLLLMTTGKAVRYVLLYFLLF
jgi:membrane protein YqaA with SNARE-associated domain